MPYPNYHSCRVREPNLFKKDSFRTLHTKTKGLSIIVATLKKTGKTIVQSYRYNKKEWDKDRAQKHCNNKKGRFEASSQWCNFNADHAFFHSIFPKVKKEEWGGWTLESLVKAHTKISKKIEHTFNRSSELDCLSKLSNEISETLPVDIFLLDEIVLKRGFIQIEPDSENILIGLNKRNKKLEELIIKQFSEKIQEKIKFGLNEDQGFELFDLVLKPRR
jgi:hypothetical protein